MKVGEILLAHGWIDAATLDRAIREQPASGRRLCSLLIARGLLDPDHAACALAEQHGVPAVQQRHLEHRDAGLAALLPAALAHHHAALPIGRTGDGTLIVGVRDPSPELAAALAQATGERLRIAVAPATQLERLIDASYEAIPTEEYDVDLTTGPIVNPEAPDAPSFADLGSLVLVGLDDAGVDKDPTQSGTIPVPKERDK